MNRIVFGSANHWTSPCQVGSHAWARLFASHDWETAYLSDPVTPWHWLASGSRRQNHQRFDLWRHPRQFPESGRLCSWVPGSLIAPRNQLFFRSSWTLKNWASLSWPPVADKVREMGFDSPDALWLDSVRHIYWAKQIHPRKIILRVADWSAGFGSVPPSILKLEESLVRESDMVIASAETLSEKLKDWRGKAPLFTIRNGVDTSFWSAPLPEPPEYAGIPAPRAVYVGALDHWFDLQLLLDTARGLPGIQFVIIGNRKFDLPSVSPSNLHWLGSRNRNVVPAYLQFAQAGIIPFKRNELIDCVCPLKLYEYMACGLPVIATRWKELEHMQSPALLATGADEWIEGLKKLAAVSPSQKQIFQQYARANDWNVRWQQWTDAWREIMKKA
ncbi:MAG: glycosyltransferase [Verrucomicrobiae bacterium]|nr:glycosyltransferase [Verrucomicrobiae bacterium]